MVDSSRSRCLSSFFFLRCRCPILRRQHLPLLFFFFYVKTEREREVKRGWKPLAGARQYFSSTPPISLFVCVFAVLQLFFVFKGWTRRAALKNKKRRGPKRARHGLDFVSSPWDDDDYNDDDDRIIY